MIEKKDDMQKETTGMSVVLLVKLENDDSLFRVSTFEGVPFKAWVDRDGVDLFWKGRLVDMLFTMGASCDRWRSVPVPRAARSLLKRGKAERVCSAPEPEGGLPE